MATVGSLKEFIKDLPDDMPLAVRGNSDSGWYDSYVDFAIKKLTLESPNWRGNLSFDPDQKIGEDMLVIE